MILYKKLLEIDKKRKIKISQNILPNLNFKKKNKEIKVQNDIKTLAQENLFMLKRLLEKTSNIDNRKLKEDFEKNQEYKNLKCNYPSINFYSNQKKNEPIITSFNYNQDKSKNNTNTFPTLYKISSLQFNNKRRTHISKLDEQYYKNAKKTKKLIIESEKNINKNEEENGSGSGSGSGSGDDDDENKSGSGDGSGSGNGSGRGDGSGDGSGSGSGSGSGDVSGSEDKESSQK